ncbi:hypothetical protein FA13DRAFT_1819250 [Coprinellus micaceus]|uniref:DUF6534 domain-containing protein n=1 Tax=Coprinellus micaceus TaxID=71717 RepID=A0A4Y7SKX5_COPMI|nr:hypothetical protein FA13DRAFT_1819250 [Coprinellus micaceus]
MPTRVSAMGSILRRTEATTRVTPTFKHWAGGQMLSAVVTTMLFGVALFLVLRYIASHSRNDPLSVKVLVWALAVLSAFEAAFANHQMYRYFVLENDVPERSDHIYASITGRSACIILTAFVAQLFYAARIWKVGISLNSPLRYSVVPILGLALTQVGGGMIQVVIRARSKTFTAMNGYAYYAVRSVYIHGSASTACDVLITAALVLILRTTSVDSTRRTKNLLHQIIVYTINRGIVTSFLAVSSILLFEFASGTMYYLIPFSANTHVYVISVVSMLTAREGLREKLGQTFHLSDLMTTTGAGTGQSAGNITDIFASQPPSEAHPEQPDVRLKDGLSGRLIVNRCRGSGLHSLYSVDVVS